MIHGTEEGKNRRRWSTAARTLLCLLLAVCAFAAFSAPDIRLSSLLPKHKKTLTIGFFYGGTGPRGYEGAQNTVLSAIKEYHKQYPDVELRFEKGILCDDYSEWLMGKYLEGIEPDVFVAQQEDLSALAEKNMLMPLPEEPPGKEPVSYPPLLEACRWGGVLYALPVMCNPQMMAVNTCFLRTYVGHDPGTDWSWGEFRQMCRICTRQSGGALDHPRYGVTGYTWEMAAASNAARLFDEYGIKNYLAETRCVQAVTFHYRLNGLLTDMADFSSGHVAFSPMWADNWRKYSTEPYAAVDENSFSWYCTTMPAGPGGDNISRTELLAGAITRRNTCREEAVRFLKILAEDNTIQQSVLEQTWCLPASSKILPHYTGTDRISADGSKSSHRAGAVDYDMLDQILQKAVVIRRFGEYEDILHKLDREIGEAGSSSGNFAVSLRKISNTMETYAGKH